MNYEEHLPPHFQATYGDDEAQVLIATGQMPKGSLPSRAASLVRERYFKSTENVPTEKPVASLRNRMDLAISDETIAMATVSRSARRSRIAPERRRRRRAALQSKMPGGRCSVLHFTRI